MLGQPKRQQWETQMYTFFIVVAGLVLSGLICISVVNHYGQKIILCMPIMQWMTIDEIAKIECPRLVVMGIMTTLVKRGHAEARQIDETDPFETFLQSLDPRAIKEIEVEKVPRLQFSVHTAEFFEYRLLSRPSHKRRRWFLKPFRVPDFGTPAPA
jgi:hypothetical protein